MNETEISNRIKELDDIKGKIRYYTKLDDFADWYLYALNEPLSAELEFWANPSEAGKQLPQEMRNLRFKTIEVLLEVLRHGHFLSYQEGKRIPRCALCSKHFFAKRDKQIHCPTCSRKISRKGWRESYEREHGHPYRQKREPKYIKTVRKLLAEWPEFTPTMKNKRALAGDANITLEQCEAALVIIHEEKKAGQDSA
jgi:DNA-directed RNA polymerase subunit RPC12/RpoP